MWLVALWMFSTSTIQAQSEGPVKWVFSTYQGEQSDEIQVVVTAQLKDGWHIYSQTLEPGGPMPTKVSFGTSEDFVLIGRPNEEGKPESSYSQAFDTNTVFYSNSVSFVQKVKLKKPVANISGRVEYMLCTKDRCMLPTDVPFTLTGKSGG